MRAAKRTGPTGTWLSGTGPVQLTRGRVLTETPGQPVSGRVAIAPPTPARDRNAADRLALKHWPRRHRILVCSLTGGTGRTAVAALIAATPAGLPCHGGGPMPT